MNAKTKLQKLKVWTLTVSMAITLCLTAFPMTAYAQTASITMLYPNSTPNTLSGYDYTFTVGETIHLCFQCQPSPNSIVGDPSVTAGTLPSGLYIGDVNPGARQFFVMGTCSDATNGAVSVTLSATTINNGAGTRAITITVNKASPTISGSNTLSGTAGYFGDLTATATITNGWFGGSTPGMALVATITDGTHTATATATATAASVDFVFPAAQLNTLVAGGPYDIIVSAFAGNDNNNGFAAQKIGELMVGAKATPAVNLTATAGATFNDDITLTATVSPAENGATPTGTITFVQGDTTLATLSLDDLGTSTYVVPSPFDAGSYTYTATYSGDDNYNAGSATATLDVPEGIFLSTNQLNFIAAGETKPITVMSNTAWSLASDAGWATITSANDDSYTMLVTAKSNPAAAQRSMLFTFRAGADVKTLRVTQDGLDATAIPPADAPQVIVYSQDGKVVVKSDAPIKSVIVYDVTGKVLKVLKVPNEVNRLIAISGLPKQQMLIVKVTSDERQTANYKLIIH